VAVVVVVVVVVVVYCFPYVAANEAIFDDEHVVGASSCVVETSRSCAPSMIGDDGVCFGCGRPSSPTVGDAVCLHRRRQRQRGWRSVDDGRGRWPNKKIHEQKSVGINYV
jgi:hypothetical protein